MTDVTILARTDHTPPEGHRPARGILIGLAISAVFWAGLLFLIV